MGGGGQGGADSDAGRQGTDSDAGRQGTDSDAAGRELTRKRAGRVTRMRAGKELTRMWAGRELTRMRAGKELTRMRAGRGPPSSRGSGLPWPGPWSCRKWSRTRSRCGDHTHARARAHTHTHTHTRSRCGPRPRATGRVQRGGEWSRVPAVRGHALDVAVAAQCWQGGAGCRVWACAGGSRSDGRIAANNSIAVYVRLRVALRHACGAVGPGLETRQA